MTQHAVILSNTFSNSQGGDFRNQLNQSLNFDSTNEEWKVSLGEFIYYPQSWENVREGSNTIEIEISDYRVKELTGRKFFISLWQYIDPPTPHMFYAYRKVKRHMNAIGNPRWSLPGEHKNFRYSKDGKHYLRVNKYLRREEIERSEWVNIVYESFDSEYNPTPGQTPYQFQYIDYAKLRNNDGYFTPYSCVARIPIIPRKDGTIDRKTVKVPPGSYTADKFLDTINQLLSKSLYDVEFGYRKFPYDYTGVEPIFFIDYVSTTNTATLKVDEDYHEMTNVKIRFHPILQYLLGFVKFLGQDLDWIKWPRNKELRKHPGPNRGNLTYFKFEGKHAIDVTKPTIANLFLFCDICEPMIVNEQKLQLLRMIQLDSQNHLIFPLQLRKISNLLVHQIKIWITEDLFNPNPIVMSDTFVKLIFKRFKKCN